MEEPTIPLTTSWSDASTPANHYEIMNKLARFMYENALDSAYYSVNVLWPLAPGRLVAGKPEDLRALGSYEFAKHRQQ